MRKVLFKLQKIAFYFAVAFYAACNGGSLENPQKLQIEMLDVGQGLSFLIKSEHCNTLYDTGTPKSGIDTMLQNRGVKKLCTVILSHWHNDHVGGVPLLAQMSNSNEIIIDRVLYAKDSLLTSSAANFRDSCLMLLSGAGITASEISRNDTIADFLPWTARVLFPNGNSSLTENAASIAIRLSDSQDNFLFMGDLHKEQEKQILELEPLLNAFAVQIGHHGSRTSSSWDFLAAVQPKMAFISASLNNQYGHPHPETLQKLKRILPDTTQIFRTGMDGSVMVEWIYKVGMWRMP